MLFIDDLLAAPLHGRKPTTTSMMRWRKTP
jgi:hypothetical protein